jgi:catechol 2,3-dioxygenase-like lactoylglutathione lyase family enzyme
MGGGVLHHVEINVRDLDRSKAFWGWFLPLLGWKRFQEWPKGASWRLGETYVVFVQTEAKYVDAAYHRRRAGLNHLAFHARSREQVDEITAKLRERGITILYEARHPHAAGRDQYAVFFEDLAWSWRRG